MSRVAQNCGPNPVDDKKFWSIITFGFVSDLIKKGRKQSLDFVDVEDLPKDRNINNVYDSIRSQIDNGFSALGAIFFTYKSQIGWGIVFSLGNAGFQIGIPFLIEKLLSIIQSDNSNSNHALAFAIILFICQIGSAILYTHTYYHITQLGVDMRALATLSIFQKALRLSNYARGSTSIGEILTLMSIDSDRIWTALDLLQWSIVCPIVSVVAFSLLLVRVGWPAWIGLSVFISILGLNAIVAFGIGMRRNVMVRSTGERVKQQTEVLQGIRAVKFNAWETPLLNKIKKLRHIEINALRKFLSLAGINGVFMIMTPALVSCGIFGAMAIKGDRLTVSKSYSIIALVNLLKNPGIMLPICFKAVADFFVSFKRIKFFYDLEDLPDCRSLSVHPFAPKECNDKSNNFSQLYVNQQTENKLNLSDDPTNNIVLEMHNVSLFFSKPPENFDSMQADIEKNKIQERRKLIMKQINSIKTHDNDNNDNINLALNICNNNNNLNSSDNNLSFGLNDPLKSNIVQSLILPVISNVSVQVFSGELLCVVGPTGCGKSSLLNGFVGRMFTFPHFSVNDKSLNPQAPLFIKGHPLFFTQESWIRDASIESNITFDLPKNEDIYMRAIEWSQLQKDLSNLDEGDQTEVGERGIALSGGQKARVCFARVIYRALFDTDNVKSVILDDPLSAVDAKVARKMFDEAIFGLTKAGIAVVLAMNANYSYLPRADKILVLDEGGIILGVGKIEELMKIPKILDILCVVEVEDEDVEINSNSFSSDAIEKVKSLQISDIDNSNIDKCSALGVSFETNTMEIDYKLPQNNKNYSSKLNLWNIDQTDGGLNISTASAMVSIFKKNKINDDLYDSRVQFSHRENMKNILNAIECSQIIENIKSNTLSLRQNKLSTQKKTFKSNGTHFLPLRVYAMTNSNPISSISSFFHRNPSSNSYTVEQDETVFVSTSLKNLNAPSQTFQRGIETSLMDKQTITFRMRRRQREPSSDVNSAKETIRKLDSDLFSKCSSFLDWKVNSQDQTSETEDSKDGRMSSLNLHSSDCLNTACDFSSKNSFNTTSDNQIPLESYKPRHIANNQTINASGGIPYYYHTNKKDAQKSTYNSLNVNCKEKSLASSSHQLRGFYRSKSRHSSLILTNNNKHFNLARKFSSVAESERIIHSLTLKSNTGTYPRNSSSCPSVHPSFSIKNDEKQTVNSVSNDLLNKSYDLLHQEEALVYRCRSLCHNINNENTELTIEHIIKDIMESTEKDQHEEHLQNHEKNEAFTFHDNNRNICDSIENTKNNSGGMPILSTNQGFQLKQSEDSEAEDPQNYQFVPPTAICNKHAKTNGRVEDKRKGAMGFDVYASYFIAGANGKPILGFVLAASIILFYSAVMTVRWAVDLVIGYWSEAEEKDGFDKEDRMDWVKWYGLSVLGAVIIVFFREQYSVWASCRSAIGLHDNAIKALFNAPVPNFFDITPLGRIINRLSKDLDAIDIQLPESLNDFIWSGSQIIIMLVTVIIATPYFAIVVIPVAIIFIVIQGYFRTTFRETRRLESISRSPCFVCFEEALQGSAVIQTMNGSSKVYEARMRQALNGNTRFFMLNSYLSRWLALRLDLVASCTTMAAALLLIYLPKSWIDPKMAGMALTNIVQLSTLLQWCTRYYADMESTLSSVERLVDLSHIPKESPALKGIKPVSDRDESVTVDQSGYHERNSCLVSLGNNGYNEGKVEISNSMDLRNNDMKNDLAELGHSKKTKSYLVQPIVNEQWPQFGKIELKSACFRYRPELPLSLKNATVKILPGESVGICGRSGAGKSTLIQALFRLVELDSGSILIDGLDTARVGIETLRSRLSIIPQDPVLISGSIRENLDPRWFFSTEELWYALTISHISTDIQLAFESLSSSDQKLCIERAKKNSKLVLNAHFKKESYLRHTTPDSTNHLNPSFVTHTDQVNSKNIKYNFLQDSSIDYAGVNCIEAWLSMEVSERGDNFSQGQKQLLCMARALVKKSKIIVLDEATASVDLRTDALLQTSLQCAMGGATVITIAHRLATIAGYDRVLVMHDGEIVEDGSPFNLLNNTDSYFGNLARELGNEGLADLKEMAMKANKRIEKSNIF